MCTISFIPLSNTSYLMGSNRDELKTRARAQPPEIHQPGNWVAPIDTKAGGTWFGTNSLGISYTVINNYQASNPLLDHNEQAKSRGLLIPELVQCRTLVEASQFFRSVNYQLYNPFEIIAVRPKPLSVMRWSWDGEHFSEHKEEAKPQIWVSAGFDRQRILEIREEVFLEMLKERVRGYTIMDLVDYHSSQKPRRGAESVAMYQEKVQTVSATLVHVDDRGVRGLYHDGYPEKEGKWSGFELPF